jgi:hypothetical protein
MIYLTLIFVKYQSCLINNRFVISVQMLKLFSELLAVYAPFIMFTAPFDTSIWPIAILSKNPSL